MDHTDSRHQEDIHHMVDHREEDPRGNNKDKDTHRILLIINTDHLLDHHHPVRVGDQDHQ